MDISKVDKQTVEYFAIEYNWAMAMFEVEPVKASAKLQRKIRKRIKKDTPKDIFNEEEIKEYVGKSASDTVFFEFLEACYEDKKEKDEAKQELMQQTIAHFSANVKKEIETLFEDGNVTVTENESGVEINRGCLCSLQLIDGEIKASREVDEQIFLNQITKVDGKYCIKGEMYSYENGEDIPVEIYFTDIKINVENYDLTRSIFMETPWKHIVLIASNIVSKTDIVGDYLNDKEKALLPLAKELSCLKEIRFNEEDKDVNEFPLLKNYIEKYQHDELLPFVKKVEENISSDNDYKYIKKLVGKLNEYKYEPMWREIYNQIVDSQKEYPSEASVSCSLNQLEETRNSIQKYMEEQGYSGKYPDFTKKGVIKGIRSVESYNKTCLIMPTKNAVHHIHCVEICYDDVFEIEFLCGAEFLRKNEEQGDVYSCAFDEDGRRFLRTVYYETSCVEYDRETEAEKLKKYCKMAVKRAELIKLTKEEKEELHIQTASFISLFLVICGLIGGLFGVFMTVGFMIITAVACLLFGNPQEIPEMFLTIPWWQILLSSWGIFGIIMTIMIAVLEVSSDS